MSPTAPRTLFDDKKVIQPSQEWHSDEITVYPGETLHVHAKGSGWFYFHVCDESEYVRRSKKKGGRFAGYEFPSVWTWKSAYHETRESSAPLAVRVVIRVGFWRGAQEISLRIWTESPGGSPKTCFTNHSISDGPISFKYGHFYPEALLPISIHAIPATSFLKWAVVAGFAGLTLLGYYLLSNPISPETTQKLSAIAEIALVLTTLALAWATMSRLGEGGGGKEGNQTE